MFEGVYTALITPFDETLELNEEGLRHNIQFQIEQGIDGILVLGTTGESPTLTQNEKIRVIEIAREETQNKIPLMVGVGTYATKTTIENAKLAQDLGADSLLVVTPFYNKPTQSGIIQHFEHVSNSVSLPIMVYNIQGRCGQNIETNTLASLAKHPNIQGVKEASGNLFQIMDVIGRLEGFDLLSGDDALTFPVMTLGGKGVISVASNLIPKEIKKLVSISDISSARDLHYKLLPIINSLFIETNPIPIKAAMTHFGMPAGNCRLPLCSLSDEHLNALIKQLDQTEWLHETKALNV